MEVTMIVTAFVLAATLSFFFKARRFVEVLSLLVSAFALVMSSVVAYKVGSSGVDYVPFSFVHIDAISAISMLVVSIVAFAVAVYAVPYFRKETEKAIIDYGHIRQY